MAGLLDEEEKSWVGNAYEGVMGRLSEGFQTYKDLAVPSQEMYEEIIDLGVSSLGKLGVSDELLYGRPTTTEDDLDASIRNTIFNLPSQVPKLAKEALEVVYNPVESGVGLLRLLEGAGTNASDVFYDTLTPSKYEEAFKEFRSRGATEQSLENEAMASSLGTMAVEMLSTAQGRRELFQQYGLEGLIGLSVLPKNLLKLSKVQQLQT